jgi:hypothetical protein
MLDKQMNLCRITMRLGLIVLPIGLGAMGGCDKDDSIQRYEIAKTSDDAPAAAPVLAPTADAKEPIRWTVPPTWKQLPGKDMRYASFVVLPEHPDLQVTVVPLAGAGGSLLDNINRWEGQIGLAPSTESDLKGLISAINIAGTPAVLFDRTGAKPADGTPPKRILAAILAHGDRTWFFKLDGSNDLVGGEKDNFDHFVRSIRFDDVPDAATDMTPAPTPAVVPDAPLPVTFTLPAGWQQESGSQSSPFRVVAFKVGTGSDTAEAVVTHVAKDSGTMLENINRWRGQLDLDPVDNAEKSPYETVKTPGGDATVWDFENPASHRRMIIAMITHGTEWWFFKLDGSSTLVGAQKPNFNSFVTSIQFRSNAGE